jgi:hypothetical protein
LNSWVQTVFFLFLNSNCFFLLLLLLLLLTPLSIFQLLQFRFWTPVASFGFELQLQLLMFSNFSFVLNSNCFCCFEAFRFSIVKVPQEHFIAACWVLSCTLFFSGSSSGHFLLSGLAVDDEALSCCSWSSIIISNRN